VCGTQSVTLTSCGQSISHFYTCGSIYFMVNGYDIIVDDTWQTQAVVKKLRVIKFEGWEYLQWVHCVKRGRFWGVFLFDFVYFHFKLIRV
jgi:hypothetical protein